MEYAIGAATGLAWGAVAAWLNSRINKAAISKNSAKSMLTANFVRALIDVAALGLVFLLRHILPWNYEAMIIGTAVSLGILTVVFAFLLTRPEKSIKEEQEE